MSLNRSLENVPIIRMIQSFVNPQKGYEEAEKGYLPYTQPFFQGGLDQYGRLNQAVGDLMSPDLMSKWGAAYETSPWAKQLLEQNKASGLDAASSMGLMGSSAALGNIQQGAGNIVAQDRQRFIENMMKQYLSGIGLGEDIYKTGAGMGAQMGQDIAGLRFGKQNSPGKLLENLLRTGANMYGAAHGGGAAAAANQYNG